MRAPVRTRRPLRGFLRTIRTIRTSRTSPAGSVLVLLTCLVLAGAAGAAPRVILRTPLAAGLQGEIRADATLVVRAPDADEPALTATLAAAPRRRPAVAAAPHVGRASEGCEGGQRGLSVHADDDGDGRVDEDPLNGRDDDGDGRVDEDFAAVGDHMLVVDRGAAGGHVEYYRWAYPRLQPIVFAAPSAGAAPAATWQLESAGSDWVETDVRGLRHEVTGRAEESVTHAYVTHVEAGAGGPAWLGVAVLDEPDADGSGRVVLEGPAFTLRLGPRPVGVAVCVGDTWLGLVRQLTEAAAVREGLADPVTGEHVPWIAPPPCSRCRDAAPPAFRWRLDVQGHLVLAADVAAGAAALLDPDRFGVEGTPLGAPDRIVWLPAGGDEVGCGWYAMAPARLARTGVGLADPYAVLAGAGRHGDRGTLEFLFRAPPASVLAALTGGTARRPADHLDLAVVGGPATETALAAAAAGVAPVRSGVDLGTGVAEEPAAPLPGDQARLLAGDAARLTLAPDLLQGWPNPFQDVINLRFRVPSTVGEAFRWEKGAQPPPGLDLTAPVPWPGGQPHVSVKIYSVSGRELASLHEGVHLAGEVTVHWNGTDAFGRQVASGTYFCKLQMDDWSTTRRIVHVR